MALVYVIARKYLDIHRVAPSPTPITQEYIPRYSLPGESQWVLDFSRDYGNPKWTGEGPRPFNTEWVRKAAFNIIMAEQAANVGNDMDAVEYYEDALEILPELKGIKVPLGTLYFKLEEFDKALSLLEDAPESDLTPPVLNNLGAACISAKAYERAETYLQQAIDAEPAYAEPMKNMAELYKAQDRTEEAIAAFEKYSDLRPMDIDTQHSFALYLTKLGKWEEAAQKLNDLTEELPDDKTLFLLLARAEINNGNHPQAIEALQRYIQLSDPNAALAYMSTDEFDQVRTSDEFQAMIKTLEALAK